MNQDPLVQMKLDFIADASEKVEKLSQSLATFDPDDPAAGAGVGLLFRTAHSLKGTAGMFGLGRVSELAASIESVLEIVRSGTLTMDSRVAGLLLDAFDEISVLFANARGQGTEDHAAEIIAKIEGFVGSISGAGRTGKSDVDQPRWAPTVGPRQIPTDRVASQLGRHEKAALHKHIEEGRRIFLIEFPDGKSGLHGDEVILRRMQALGEIITVLSPSGTPGTVDAAVAAANLDTADGGAGPEAANPQMALVFALKRSEQDLREIVSDSKATISELLPQTGEAGATDLPAASDDGREGLEPGERRDRNLPEARLDVKIGIDVLDSIMNTISELYSVRVGLNGVADRLPRNNETRRLRDDLLKISLLINKRVSALEQTITEVRLVPMAMLFERYRGEVRRLAKGLGKSVGLAFEGEATLVDRALLERLYDPLLHVIRNAIGHGIEAAAERTAAGKHSQGTVLVRARQESNHIRIDVRDDGRGIDVDKIRAVAEAKGMSLGAEESAVELLFRPGFSTKDGVDDVSGRGVGLDAVKTQVEAVRGATAIDSEAGASTTVSIWVPLTLAVSRGVLVEEHDVPIIIPLGSVTEILLLQKGLHDDVLERGTLEYKGQDFPVVSLSRTIGFERCSRPRYAVLTGVGDRRRAIAVHAVCGETQIVSRPLPCALSAPCFVSGAAELHDGRAAVIVQPEEMSREAPPVREHRIERVCNGTVPAADMIRGWVSGKLLKMLVFRSGGGVFASPLCLLKEVVQVTGYAKLPVLGGAWQGLFFARGMCHGLLRLGEPPFKDDGDTSSVVIFRVPERCGIGADEILGNMVVPYRKLEVASGGAGENPFAPIGIFKWKDIDVGVIDIGGVLRRVLLEREDPASDTRQVSKTEPLMQTPSPDDK